MKRRNGMVVGALAGALALAAGALSPAVAEVVEVDTIGGPLHAEMYPSGADTTFDGGVVIADTGNNQVAKYDAAGNEVWRVGSYGTGTLEFDNPRDIGVDAANNVYVADTRNSRIVKLSATGQWLGATNGVGGPSTRTYSFPLGVSVQGNRVYVGDTGRHRVVVTDLAGVVQAEVVARADTACANINDLRDAQADSEGNIYVAGYRTNQVVKFDAAGNCLTAWGGTGPGNGRFRTPYGVDLATDPVTGRELVYVADGLNNRAQVFEKDGTYVTQFGTYGEPTQEGTFTTMRRVAVAKDGSGAVWAADLWGNRVERWDRTPTGFSYAATIGAVLPEPTDTAVFHEPRGMAFLPGGDLLVADTVHHSVQRFDASGSYVSTCGQRAAEGSRPGQFNWPRGVAVDPATGNIWLADTKQHQLQVLTQNCTDGRLIRNNNAGTDSRSFNWPYDITIRPSDRFAFVVDTQNHRIKAYDVAAADDPAAWPIDNKGPEPKHVFGTRGSGLSSFNWPSGITTDADGFVYVADRGNNRITKFSYAATTGFARVATYTAGGSLNGPEGVAVDGEGRIYVADSADDQVVVLSSTGSVVQTINGLSHPGNLVISPSGELYVADTYADVIRVYDLDDTPAPDTTPPVGTVTTPSPDQSFVEGDPIVLGGTATDDRGVAKVYVAVQRTDLKTWLRANGQWGTFQWVEAALDAQGRWSFPFTPPATGRYGLQLRVDDTSGNQNEVKGWRTFQVEPGGTSPDTTAPVGTVTTPTPDQSFPSGGPLVLRGTASDDRGVAKVYVAVQRTSTRTWLRANGQWGTFQWVEAALDAQGAWSFPFTPPANGGYALQLRVDDTSGNQNEVKGWVPFRVEAQSSDSATPTATVTSPAANATVANPVTISGTASDDVGVARVRLGLRNAATGLWWNGTGWQAAGIKVDALLSTPGAATTGWSLALPTLTNATYGYSVDVVDTAGKLGTPGSGTPAWRTFTVTG